MKSISSSLTANTTIGSASLWLQAKTGDYTYYPPNSIGRAWSNEVRAPAGFQKTLDTYGEPITVEEDTYYGN